MRDYPDFIIDRLKVEDIPECLHIIRENWGIKTAQSCHIEFGQAFGSAVWKPIFYVARKGDRVIGTVGYAVSWMNYGIYDITWLNVLPLHQRKGVGQALVSQCLEDIRAIGLLAMLCTDIPEYYERHWGFVYCFKYGTDTIMRLELAEVEEGLGPIIRPSP